MKMKQIENGLGRGTSLWPFFYTRQLFNMTIRIIALYIFVARLLDGAVLAFLPPSGVKRNQQSPQAFQDSMDDIPMKKPGVVPLTSLENFVHYIDDGDADSLSVIKFHAKSCRLCKRVDLRYQKMARFYANAPVRFAKVEKSAHPQLFQTLDVQTYPFIQIYRNGQCVASHGIPSETAFEPKLHDTIQQELSMSSQDWNTFLTAFAEPIHQSSKKLETLRGMLQASQ